LAALILGRGQKIKRGEDEGRVRGEEPSLSSPIFSISECRTLAKKATGEKDDI